MADTLHALQSDADALKAQVAAQRAGLPGRYRGHSLRRGGATAARRAGHDLVTIARQEGTTPVE